jgi:hypothetical protein
MSAPMWGERPPPQPSTDSAVWDGRPLALADITQLRLQLRAGLADGGRPREADEDDVERLLLIFDELTSNGLRHGRAPVRVVVTTTGTGWLIDVSDAATDSPPAPAVGRAAADGGLGLVLVGRLSAAHGWTVQDDRKHVWAQVSAATKCAPDTAVAAGNLDAWQSARDTADNLRTALESRGIIDQAKGILMERHKLTADQAFRVLAEMSMMTDRKLRAIADELVDIGELPDRRVPRS